MWTTLVICIGIICVGDISICVAAQGVSPFDNFPSIFQEMQKNFENMQKHFEKLHQNLIEQSKTLAAQAQAIPPFGQGAFSFASTGKDGSYHTAAVFPENAGMPNIINQHTPPNIGDDDGKGHFYSVGTSSWSVNNNGNRKQHAETVVNDNGKVTKYERNYP